MSLNNIQLNPSLLADMYKACLVDTNETVKQSGKKQTVLSAATPTVETGPVAKNVKSPAPKYLGEYKKNILIIVRYDATPYLPDEQLNFLTTVLSACKLNLGDVAIFNIATSRPALYKDLQEKFKSSFTILFGLTPEEFEMPLSFPEFQVQPFNNCTFLHAPVLEALEADKVLKSKLWVCLRKMFGV
jgi:hypothetical protein